MERYTEALDCIVWYCIGAVSSCTAAARYFMVDAQYYTAATQCCMELELD
jgi:hypothetical protein